MPTTYDPGALPGPLGSDPADGPAQIGALAQRIAAFKDGLTTAQRNALTGDDLWDGRRIWNTETQRVEVYNAATPGWAPVGVTDHAALSNLTTGDPHTQYVRKALATAKGDLLVATASGVITRKAVGANGRVLTADSAQSDGLAWTDLSGTYLAKAGGTMTGDLTLAGDPDSPLKAATKQYVDAAGGGAMELIAETLLGSAAASIVLSSIPADYDHLMMLVQARGSANGVTNLIARFNGDTASNYGYAASLNTAGAWQSLSAGSATSIYMATMPGFDAAAGEAVAAYLYIPRYAATTFNKQLIGGGFGQVVSASPRLTQFGGSWRSTAAITSITIALASGNNLVTGSKVSLYGIAGA